MVDDLCIRSFAKDAVYFCIYRLLSKLVETSWSSYEGFYLYL